MGGPGSYVVVEGSAGRSLRANFTPSIAFVGAVLLALLIAFTEYADEGQRENVDQFYIWFNHVMFMIFVGFGFLMTFLRRYSLSAVCLNFFCSAIVFVAAILMIGTTQQIIWGPKRNKIHIELPLMIDATFCAGSSMIAFGAVIGKTTPTQTMWLLLMQVPLYAFNQHLTVNVFKALDMGGTIVIHAFGCYYGLAASLVISRKQKNYGLSHSKMRASYVTDVTSMIGTLFLWLYWPSFNGALASVSEEKLATATSAQTQAQFLSVLNTVLSLMGSALATFAVSALAEGRINTMHIQNATLAGGVAMGSACTLRMSPGGALGVGLAAGVLSTLGFAYLMPFLDRTLRLGDTCGIHNLHGMPSILGALVTGFVAFNQQPDYLFHTPGTQMRWQVVAVLVAIGIGLAGGAIAGWLVSVVNFVKSPALSTVELFEDGAWWVGLSVEPIDPTRHSSIAGNPNVNNNLPITGINGSHHNKSHHSASHHLAAEESDPAIMHRFYPTPQMVPASALKPLECSAHQDPKAFQSSVHMRSMEQSMHSMHSVPEDNNV